LAAMPKLDAAFHVPLQSGCDRTLHRMSRPYTAARYEKAVALLRAAFPKARITTDCIAGFPGETLCDFEETLAFVGRMRFDDIHVFPYSPRQGTPAAGFPDQVPAPEKERRSQQLRNLIKG